MDFMVYLTERCNLQCRYCETAQARAGFVQDPAYSIQTLTEFLNKAPKLGLHFYGGEPLLNVKMMQHLLDTVNYRYCTLQTNGINLDKVGLGYLNRINVISISIDGRKQTNDNWRGQGAYDLALGQAKKLRKRGYGGEINARMTISPGLDIETEVRHLLFEAGFEFDRIHWQLNALFHEEPWKECKKEIISWFENNYNPQILRLIYLWAEEIRKNGKVMKLVPFTGVMQSLITGTESNNVRCGAGHQFWAISTRGDVSPCPVMRDYREALVGNIEKDAPQDIRPQKLPKGKCTSCRILSVCGGRCLCPLHRNEWDEKGFDLVCSSVYNLVLGLGNYAEMVREKIRDGLISVEDFDCFHDYEVIP